MKVPKSVSKLLENKYVLYFVLFLAVSNLLGYMLIGNINAVILFILIGALMTFFSKNMIIVLAVPLVLTSVLLVGNKVSEGFEDSVDAATATATAPEDTVDAPNDAANADPTATTELVDDNGVTIPKRPRVAVKNAITENHDTITSSTAATTTGVTTPAEPMSLYRKKNNRIDYASTLEDAYGDITNLLGKDGIKNLTADTQNLMDQQKQLAEALKSMGPLIGQAKSMLKDIDITGITDIAKKFTTK